MVEKALNLVDLAANPHVLPGKVRNRVEQILNGQQGLLPITGQPGTGKTTTLLVIAHLLNQKGLPVKLLTQDDDFLTHLHFSLPPAWSFQTVRPAQQSWLEAIQPLIADPEVVIVVDQLSGENDEAALAAAAAGCWVLTCIDTPFVGLDVLYNLQGLGLSTQRIAGTVVGIISQFLLPRLCQHCGQSMEASLEETQLIFPNRLGPEDLWREQGCPECEGRGTKGRCAAFEVLHADETVKPFLEGYLEQNVLDRLPVDKHFTMGESARTLVKEGWVGIQTYRHKVLQNPLLRLQHFWEKESLRAARIEDMFGRFVTQQLVERLMSQSDFETIMDGERRHISCLFCDVRGFTARAEQHSPVELFLTLNRYFREIIITVFQFDGMIDKFIGDSVMVVFGTPVEQSDQELRAVHCAIAIQKQIAEINRTTTEAPVSMGIGINSGEVIAGCLGSDLRMDYTVIGDVVNIAARLESQAKPGQILMGPATYHAVSEQIECRAVGTLSLKGKAQSLETFEVLYGEKQQ